MDNKDVQVAALCDVYKPYTTRDRSAVPKRYLDTGKIPKMGETMPKSVKRYNDFRRMLDDKSIDAVCIATPDHWHAIQTIMTLDAGKDIYVEKPLTITLREGRKMVEAHAKTDRVVQVGLNRRGSSIYQSLAGKVQDKVGRVSLARAYRVSNMYPKGIGKLKPEAPPKDLDWDLWLGPRAFRRYQYNIAPYFFRWWSDYSSQMGNWGVHYMDVIRWMLGETAPVAISAHGSNNIVDDDRTIPDTMEVTFEFASGAMVVFGIYEASGGGSAVQDGEVELRGAKGNIAVSQNGYKIISSRPGQFQSWSRLIKDEKQDIKSTQQYGDLGIKEDSTANLIRNFLDCVKSRKAPWCSLEDGHRSTSFAHLANIALATRSRIEWDPAREVITNNKQANDLLHYEYRKPWTLG